VLRDVAPYLAVFASVAAVALAGLVVWLTLTGRRLQAGQRAVLGPHGRRDLVEHTEMLEEQVRNLRDAVEMLTGSVEDYRHDLDGSLSNLAQVRFNAFSDTGGEQSSSMALLDNYRSGVVITIIATRETARLYTKHLSFGRPDRELSPEEAEAVKRAVPAPLHRDQISGPPVPTLPRRLPLWAPAGEEGPALEPIEGQEQLDLDELPESALEPRPWRNAPPPQEQTGSAPRAHEDRAAAAEEATTPDTAAVAEAPNGRRTKPDDWLGGDELEF
jgi:Protein of unknown function (DUF4446)